jgi:LysM repeat protein
MDPDQRRLRADQARVKKAQDEYHAKKKPVNEAMLMEDPLYRRFKRVGRYISEQKLTEPEILQIFADAETGMTDKATGANRTFAGRGKDATVDFAKDVSGAVNGVLNSIQNSVPVSAVDTAYDQATDALGDLAGGQKGAVMDAIKKYRNLVKEYPKTAGFAKAALVAIAGLATGGAGLPAIAGLTYALDSAIKGDKLSSVLGKGAGAAALAAAGQAIHGGATQPSTGGPADTNAFTNVNQMGDHTGEYVNMPDGSDVVSPLVAPPPDLATYTVQQGDTLSQIAQANNTTVQELVGLNPQLAAASGATGGQGLNPDVIFPGQQITLPPGTPGADVYAGGVGTNANTMADIAKGQVPDNAITQGMAAKGQASANAVGGNIDKASNPSAASDFGTGGNAPIDYTSPGPESTDSLGQKLEYGIPVNDKGSFVPPNSNLPPEELATQQAAYNAWKSDFMRRFPNASPGPDGSMLSFKPGLAPMQILQKPTLPAEVQESVKIKIIPANKLIDQKATVLNWALSESVGRQSKSVNLSMVGTYTVFENVERYRRALLEYAGTQPGRPELPDQYRPDMPGGAGTQSQPGMIGRGLNWLDRGVKKVGGALSNFGHQFTTNVTKEKLKMNWHQAGKPSDSDQLAAWLVGQGVPQEVVTSVFGKMGIPYTAPTTEPTAQPGAQTTGNKAAPATASRSMPWVGNNPATGKPWTAGEIRDRGIVRRKDDLISQTQQVAADAAADPNAVAAMKTDSLRDLAAQEIPNSTTGTTPTVPGASTAAGTFPGEDPNGPGYIGRREVARRQAARAAQSGTTPTKPNFAQQGGGYKSVNYAPNIKTGIGLPKPTTPTGTKVTAGGPTADEKAKLDQRIAQALKQPVAEMLQMVETKEDVQKIKQFIDQTFTKYGAVTESAFAVRNKIIEHVTQVGAQRRREHSQRVAH